MPPPAWCTDSDHADRLLSLRIGSRQAPPLVLGCPCGGERVACRSALFGCTCPVATLSILNACTARVQILGQGGLFRQLIEVLKGGGGVAGLRDNRLGTAIETVGKAVASAGLGAGG